MERVGFIGRDNEFPGPSQRIIDFYNVHRESMEREAVTRDEVIELAKAMAAYFPNGCEATKEVPTTAGQSNHYTWEFKHDTDESFQITRQTRWAIGGADEVTWTFNLDMVTPITDITAGGEFHIPQSGWGNVKRALRELKEAVETEAALVES